MKNFRYQIILFLGVLVLLANACKKEAALTPTDTPEPNFILPQGNHDYDQRILGYYNRWGTYVLYKFTPKDINWSVSTSAANYTSIPADTLYINPQLDLLESTFFKYYADSTLKKYLPTKFFLCSSLSYTAPVAQINAFLVNMNSTAQGGVGSFAANGAKSTVLSIPKAIYRGDINLSFLRMMDLNAKMSRSDLFISISDYTTAISGSTQLDRYKRGFLGASLPIASTDWQTYIQAVVYNSYTFLTDPTAPSTDATNRGILNAAKDPNGLINRKYNAIVSFYKQQYNIDLQAIGNGQ